MLEANRLVLREVFADLDLRAALPGLRTLVEQWRPDFVVREPAEFASSVVAHEQDIPQVMVNAGLDRMLDLFVEIISDRWVSLGGEGSLLASTRWSLLPESFDAPSRLGTGPLHRFRAARSASTPPQLPDWWHGRSDPLVYVTFGSVAAGIGLFPYFYASVLDALAGLPARVLMTVGRAGDSEALGTVPPNAHVERWWPQEEVLPHAALVVGHGGFGTTLGALAAGVPQVNVPLFAIDQFENATRAAEIGLGAVVPNRADLIETAGAMTAPNPALLRELRTAVNQALNDQSIALRARRVAGDMADLPPCVECSAVVEEMLESKGASP
jgi:hypothetical protein